MTSLWRAPVSWVLTLVVSRESFDPKLAVCSTRWPNASVARKLCTRLIFTPAYATLWLSWMMFWFAQADVYWTAGLLAIAWGMIVRETAMAQQGHGGVAWAG